MFFLRVTPGLALMAEFYYSIFFPQAWGYSTVTEWLHIAYQSIPNTRKGKKDSLHWWQVPSISLIQVCSDTQLP